MVKIFLLLFVCLISGSGISHAASDDPAKIDEAIDEELGIYKYSVMVESLKKFVEELEKAGVKFDALEGKSGTDRAEFNRILLDAILKGKSVSEIREWANKESAGSNYVSGKKEFEMVVNGGIVRECLTLDVLMKPTLNQLSKNVELRKLVSSDTLSYWKIMIACDFIIKGDETGDLVTDLYVELQRRYKNNGPKLLKFVLNNFVKPFHRKGETIGAPAWDEDDKYAGPTMEEKDFLSKI